MTGKGVPIIVEIWVDGVPVPQGSKRAFLHRQTGKVVMVDQQKGLRSWRRDIQAALTTQWEGGPIRDHGANVRCRFYFPRPKGHFGKKGLRPSAPLEKITKPDVDKLLRSVLDALTGIVLHDDSQVTDLLGQKLFCDEEHPRPGMWLRMEVFPA